MICILSNKASDTSHFYGTTLQLLDLRSGLMNAFRQIQDKLKRRNKTTTTHVDIKAILNVELETVKWES